MIIETRELRDRERSYKGEEPASILDLAADPFIRGGGGIRYALTARRLNDQLLVLGSLAVNLECRCARCAEWFRKNLRVPAFVRSYPLASENEAIDLTDDIREDILLALPINLVCADKCRGLCPGCGANLNKQACACPAGEPPAEWSVLDQLKLE